MPRLTPGHIYRPDLGIVAIEYLSMEQEDIESYVGTQVMPIFQSQEPSATWQRIPVAEFMRDVSTLRAPRTKYSSDDYDVEPSSFSVQDHGWEEVVDDNEARMYADRFEAENVALSRAVTRMKRDLERQISKITMNPNNAEKVDDVSIPWSDKACKAREDVIMAVMDMKSLCGFGPNVIIMNDVTLKNVMLSDEVKNHLASNPSTDTEVSKGGEEAEKLFLASYFGVGKVLVGSSRINTSPRGAKAKFDSMWKDNYVCLARVANKNNKDLKGLSFGRTILYIDEEYGNVVKAMSKKFIDNQLIVEQYYDNSLRCEIVRVRNNLDVKVINPSALYMLEHIAA